MPKVVIDAELAAKLLAAAGQNGGAVEVWDETGVLVGRLTRPLGPPTPPPGYVIEGDWPSDEELDRRVREDKRYTTAEVIAYMRQRAGEQW